MTKAFFAAVLVMATLSPVQQPPTLVIENGTITAKLYLPDAKTGYYRGTRFDWAGVVDSLTVDGHEYFGQWFEKYDPTLHDAIPGPVEEFLTGMSSPGYEDTEVGGAFMRIGVGMLRKPAEKAFQRFATYEIVDHGTWTVERRRDAITFVHVLAGAGFGYEYRKTLRLEKNRLHLEHRLANTGRKPIPTSVYNHNFFTLDRQPTGPDVVVTFPFDVSAARETAPLAVVAGRQIRFSREFQPGETMFTELSGHGTEAADYDFRIEHRRTGAGVRITSDRPIQRLVFWAHPRTVCPEPYIDVSAGVGQASTWQTTYEFYSTRSAPAGNGGR